MALWWEVAIPVTGVVVTGGLSQWLSGRNERRRDERQAAQATHDQRRARAETAALELRDVLLERLSRVHTLQEARLTANGWLDDYRESTDWVDAVRKLQGLAILVTDAEARGHLADVTDVLWWITPVAQETHETEEDAAFTVCEAAVQIIGAFLRDEPIGAVEDLAPYVARMKAIRIRHRQEYAEYVARRHKGGTS